MTTSTSALAIDPTASVPLRVDEDGTIRLINSRITLHFLIERYNSGVTADAFWQDYPHLNLADIHMIIAYYLNHREAIDAYMAKLDKEAEEIRRQWENARPEMKDIKQRLLARKAAMDAQTRNHQGPDDATATGR